MATRSGFRRPSDAFSGPYVWVRFHSMTLALWHSAQMSEECIVQCVIRVAGYEAVIKHMVNGLLHFTPSAAVLLALQAPFGADSSPFHHSSACWP